MITNYKMNIKIESVWLDLFWDLCTILLLLLYFDYRNL